MRYQTYQRCRRCLESSRGRPSSPGGWMLVELLVSAAVLVVLIAAFAMTQHQTGEWNRYELAREHCVAAAEAQLDNYTACGKGVAPDECKRLWPDVSLQVETSAGRGDWEGLTLVLAKATAKPGLRAVKVELARYIAGKPLAPLAGGRP